VGQRLYKMGGTRERASKARVKSAINKLFREERKKGREKPFGKNLSLLTKRTEKLSQGTWLLSFLRGGGD